MVVASLYSAIDYTMNVSSIQERLQLKREPLDKWSVREQLCLASAVSRSGDQNWMSVSRALKPFGDSNRPLDWFHQKNCAAQYGALLAHVETPKRKKRSGNETIMETPVECILRRLLSERQNQLRELLAEEKAEYNRLQDDMKQMQSGTLPEEQLDQWCKEIDEEEAKREEENLNRVKWLKQRDLRKQEIEQAWRLAKPSSVSLSSQKRKSPDDEFLEQECGASQYINLQRPQKPPSQFSAEVQQPPEQAKPALSPLLTSLLKTPSQVAISTSSILHTAITQQSNKLPEVSNSHSSPTITSLLHSSAISFSQNQSDDCGQPLNADILDDNNLKIDDLAKSILVQDGPFPEIKKEEVDDIISEIIENNHDIVSDPEQHLQLDGNGDINISLELDDLEQEEPTKEMTSPVKPEPPVEIPSVVDPFEFQEDPVMFESPVKPVKQEGQYLPLYQQASPVKVEETDKVRVTESAESRNNPLNPQAFDVVTDKSVEEDVQTIASDCPTSINAAHYEENDTEPISTQASVTEKAIVVEEDEGSIAQADAQADEQPPLESVEELKASCGELPKTNESTPETTSLSQSEAAPPYEDDIYDNVNMEVKIDKTGKTKRDYSRTKKKDDKNFDMLLGIEKPHLDNDDFSDKKEPVVRLMKVDNDRSNSPWAEEEDGNLKKRRYSTPMDSMPNSPASSTAYEDDKDYRNWKKSMMLVYNRLASNKYASLFFKPITEEHAPGYRAIVYRPMDLQTIKKNIDSGVIRTSLEFKRDVMLMFTNAIMFNKTRDTVYSMALQMQKESMNSIDILLQAEGQVEAPVRRETRTSESGCKRKRASGIEESAKKKKKDE